MKRLVCLLASVLLMLGLLSGCGEPEPELVSVDTETAEKAVDAYLEAVMVEFREEFALEDAEMVVTKRAVIGEDYYADEVTVPEIWVSLTYEIRVPTFTEDLVARAESRSLNWRDVQLGEKMENFLKQKMNSMTIENYEIDQVINLFDGFRTDGGERLSFTLYGDEDHGYGEIHRSFDFKEDGTYNSDLLYYSNPNLEADYYSSAEYMENAKPASASGACRYCGGTGKVKQYATNYFWDEGYYADCEVCN